MSPATETTVRDYFAGKSVLVTGATGFMGKVLVEKLIRACPEVGRVYILMRNKKGQGVKERLEDFINCQVFDRLRDEFPENISKLTAVRGDVMEDELGLSDQDMQEIVRECNVLFHCAANVRFDQKLKGAVLMNTMGTKRVLMIAEQMKNLEVFVHVSTAYCQCGLQTLEEKVYKAAHDPEKVIDLAGWMDIDILENITPKMLGPQPNTYAYTKSLTEELVASYSRKFPIVIARPSIVTAAWKEPIPGWVESLNGPTGILVGGGKGVIRTLLCQEDYLADMIPVDIAINALIALAWETGSSKPKQPYVCNLTESGVNPLSWGQALAYGRKHVYENPFSMCLWYPDGSIKSSWFLHTMCVLLLHLLPAYIIDMLFILFRKKPFMVKTQKRISGGLDLLQYYTTKEWKFNNDNFLSLPKKLGKEASVFYTDMSKVNWDEYLKSYILGAREFCCKEDPASLPRARRLLKKLYYLNLATTAVIYSLCIWAVFSNIHLLTWLAQWITSNLASLINETPIATVITEPL